MTFDRLCCLLAARRCYELGQSIAEIARSARKSPATIRRWLRETGVTFK